LAGTNAFWNGEATAGLVNPEILQAYWDGSAVQTAFENDVSDGLISESNPTWTVSGEEYGYSTEADTDFRDPWMTFNATLASGVETVTFTLFETTLDNEAASNSVSTVSIM
jgi:hypothetical protein